MLTLLLLFMDAGVGQLPCTSVSAASVLCCTTVRPDCWGPAGLLLLLLVSLVSVWLAAGSSTICMGFPAGSVLHVLMLSVLPRTSAATHAALTPKHVRASRAAACEAAEQPSSDPAGVLCVLDPVLEPELLQLVLSSSRLAL
jgi:hypothetical protein